MRRWLCTVSAAAIMISGSAFAADPGSLPPPVSACVWCGFYIGLNAGGGWNDPSASIIGLGGAAWDPYYPDPLRPRTFDRSGFVGGGQLGYDYQVNRAVFGLEADIDYSNTQGSLNTSGPGPTDPYVLSMSQRLNWLSTVRARLGLTPTPQTLIYATGGLAVGEVNTTSHLDFTTSLTNYDTSTSATKAGWTLGGGVEFSLAGNWSAKAEYLYYDLGSVTSIANPVPATPPFQTQSTFNVTGNVARVGINYKF